MDAGRELDALVAEKVLGLRLLWAHKIWSMEDWLSSDRPTEQNTMAIVVENKEDRVLSMPRYLVIPHYSTSLSAAFLVVEHMRKQWAAGDSTSNFWTLRDCGAQPWQAQIELYPDHDANIVEFEAEGETLPLAICLCALKAIGV